MKRIQSFSVNHDLLDKGLYTSRVDGDAVTYDIRMKQPNNPENDYLTPAAAHTIEHLFATYVRNSDRSDEIIYAGPMGCLTGFYLVVRDTVAPADVIRLVQESFAFVRDFTGEIPGSQRQECGNYRMHDLEGARTAAADLCRVLENWTPKQLKYRT